MPKVLPSNWNVPEVFHARLGVKAGRQRMMTHGGHLLIILHDLPEAGEGDRTASLFWRAPDGNWKSTGAAKGGVVALKSHVETFVRAAEELENAVEKGTSAVVYFDVLHKAAPLLRTARNMYKALQEARDAVPNDQALIAVRDMAGDVERTLELVYSDAQNGLDFTIAKRAEEQAVLQHHIAHSGHRLNLITALFLPITAISGMLGMNLKHGLEESYAPYLFWAVIGLTFLVGMVVRLRLDAPRK